MTHLLNTMEKGDRELVHPMKIGDGELVPTMKKEDGMLGPTVEESGRVEHSYSAGNYKKTKAQPIIAWTTRPTPLPSPFNLGRPSK